MQVSDLKLALYGQIYDSEGLLYAYPEKVTQLRASGQYPAWINALLFDSRFLRELVAPGGECFSIRYCQEGLFYSLTKYNQHDSRNGAVTIALYLQNKAASDAKQLVAVLRNLMDYFLEKNSPIGIQDADIENLLKDLADPYIIKPPVSQQEMTKQDAYRVYQSEEDLYRYLNWAIQKEYLRYKWVHFVPEAYRKTTINPALYTELATRVVNCYAIKRTDSTYELALSGTNYNVNYTKAGYLPQSITITAGQPSPYADIDDNNVIHIKPRDEISLKFKKRITIKLYDAATGAPIVKEGKQVCIPVEVEEGKTRTVFLEAEGYQSKNITIAEAKLTDAESVIRQSLHRTKISDSTINNGYNSRENSDDNDILRVRKKPLLFSAIILALIALIIGFFIGLPLGKSMHPEIATTQLNDSIKILNDSINILLKTIHSAQDTINRHETGDTTNQPMQTPIQENPQKPKDIKSISKKDNNSKSWEYLCKKKDWCIINMKRYINDGDNHKKTDGYKFLVKVLEGRDIPSIINEKNVNSDEWNEVISAINEKKAEGIDDEKITEAFKETNSESKRTKKYQDGTINLITLKNNIQAIPLN